MATYWENSCSFGLRYVSWYKYLIVSLVFSHLGFWSGNLFLIAPFPDLCLLVPLQLLGHLNFASRVILPGRSFVSYLISLSTTVNNLNHNVDLDTHCREDLHMWHKFLKNWNGVSMFYDSCITNAHDLELFTDASLIGFGAFFQNQWFCEKWPDVLPSIKESDLSMAFRELYPIVAAAIVWGKYWTAKRIMFVSDNEATVFIIKKDVQNAYQ